MGARADGAVEIELSNPEARSGHASRKEPVKVTTKGLVFNQNTQIATTDQALTFSQGAATGSARGASYDAQKGTLNLAHDVIIHAVLDGDPVTLQAQGASFDRTTHQLYLIKETADYRNQHGASDQATVYFRPDGTAEHLSAQGNVRVTTAEGGELKAANGTGQFDKDGVLRQIALAGGVLYTGHDAEHSLHVDSTDGVATFAPNRTANHLRLTGAVSIVDQQIGLPNDPHGSETRESRAGQIDIDLAPDANGKAEAKQVLAVGGATMLVHTIRQKAPQQTTRLKGDQILAGLNNGHQLSSLRATGDAALEQSTPGGLDQTSHGDQLQVSFDQTVRKTGKNGEKAEAAASDIASAVLSGHAGFSQVQPDSGGSGKMISSSGSADRITYDGRANRIELSGGTPRIEQEGSELTADSVVFDRGTGDATAVGDVRASYQAAESKKAPGGAANKGEMSHVVADRAQLNHAKDETTFTGTPQKDVRLWQEANSLTAPTIVLSRTKQLLTASGPAGSVKAAFVESGGKSKPGTPAVLRTTSASLIYSGGERKATLSGGVVAQDTSGVIRASTLAVFLNPIAGTGTKTQVSGPGGEIDRMVAEGKVQFRQGDRTGRGEKLVYTSDDGHYVLTGTSLSPPRITDPAHGAVTGSTLVFNSRDDSVEVDHGLSATEADTRTTK